MGQFNSETGAAAGAKGKRGPSIVKAIKDMLQREMDVNGELCPTKIAEAIAQHGKDGNAAMMKILLEYTDGKVPDKVHHTGDKQDIEVRFVDATSKEDEKEI